MLLHSLMTTPTGAIWANARACVSVTFAPATARRLHLAVVALTAAALPNPNLTVSINTVDHNTFQENINNYLQGNPDDVFTWFAGYRMQFFAAQGLAGDVSDVWGGMSGMSEALKKASTGEDGKDFGQEGDGPLGPGVEQRPQPRPPPGPAARRAPSPAPGPRPARAAARSPAPDWDGRRGRRWRGWHRH